MAEGQREGSRAQLDLHAAAIMAGDLHTMMDERGIGLKHPGPFEDLTDLANLLHEADVLRDLTLEQAQALDDSMASDQDKWTVVVCDKHPWQRIETDENADQWCDECEEELVANHDVSVLPLSVLDELARTLDARAEEWQGCGYPPDDFYEAAQLTRNLIAETEQPRSEKCPECESDDSAMRLAVRREDDAQGNQWWGDCLNPWHNLPEGN